MAPLYPIFLTDKRPSHSSVYFQLKLERKLTVKLTESLTELSEERQLKQLLTDKEEADLPIHRSRGRRGWDGVRETLPPRRRRSRGRRGWDGVAACWGRGAGVEDGACRGLLGRGAGVEDRWRRGSSAAGLLCERRRGAGVEDGVARGSSASGGAAPLRAAARLLCERRRGFSATSAPGLLCNLCARASTRRR
jgi:hypothetical protein